MKVGTYRNLINQIVAAVLILDAKGIIQCANQNSREILVFIEEEQLSGLNFNQIVPSEQFIQFQTIHQAIIREK